jgi:hypothetical protein
MELLPDDMLRKILNDFDYKMLLYFGILSKYFNKFINRNPQLFHFKLYPMVQNERRIVKVSYSRYDWEMYDFLVKSCGIYKSD